MKEDSLNRKREETVPMIIRKRNEQVYHHHRCIGVKVADGSEHRADFIISNADGRKTIMEMLDGKYINERIRSYCAEPADETNWAVHVFLGLNRDLSGDPAPTGSTICRTRNSVLSQA